MKIDNYANSIAETMKNAVESAFWSGFQYAQSLNLNDDEFIDLGLPSGTKWGKDYLGVTDVSEKGDYFSFVESIKYSLPTEEQVKELNDCCTFVRNTEINGFDVYGPNGNHLIIKDNLVWNNMLNSSTLISPYIGKDIVLAFWLRSDENTTKICGFLWNGSIRSLRLIDVNAALFKHQILLVKSSNSL